jgi:hypothetical protein
MEGDSEAWGVLGALSRERPSAREEDPANRVHRSPEGNLRGQNPMRAPALEPINRRLRGGASRRWSKTQKPGPAVAVTTPVAHEPLAQWHVGRDHREVELLPYAGEALKGEARERSFSETWKGGTSEKQSARRAEETLEAQRSGVRQAPCKWVRGVNGVVGRETSWKRSAAERLSAHVRVTLRSEAQAHDRMVLQSLQTTRTAWAPGTPESRSVKVTAYGERGNR